MHPKVCGMLEEERRASSFRASGQSGSARSRRGHNLYITQRRRKTWQVHQCTVRRALIGVHLDFSINYWKNIAVNVIRTSLPPGRDD